MRTLNLLGILTLVLTLFPVLASAEHVIDDSNNPSYLFVISGATGSLDGDTLKLDGVPSVIYFTDRPARKAGHITLASFIEMWDKGKDSFESDPPNAVLSVLKKDGTQNVVLELKNPEIVEDSLYFNVEVLSGDVSEPFGAAAIYIDPPQECASCSVP